LGRRHPFKDDVLRFLVDVEAPFTNNLAEQALRMMKVKMKISGAFRTSDAAQDFAALRSVIPAARKQRSNVLQTLTRHASSPINALPARPQLLGSYVTRAGRKTRRATPAIAAEITTQNYIR
jgi:hypothetical protein